MRFRYSVIALSFLIILACNQEKGKIAQVKKINREAGKVNVSSNAFVQAAQLAITEPSAVYFHPDSAKLEKLEKTLGEKFFTDAEESMGELSASRDYLVRQKIKIIETEATQLTFKKADGSVKIIDLSNPRYTWGLFLFNGKDDPQETDMAHPEKQTLLYMNK